MPVAVWMKIQVDLRQKRRITERCLGSVVVRKGCVDIGHLHTIPCSHAFDLCVKRCHTRFTSIQQPADRRCSREMSVGLILRRHDHGCVVVERSNAGKDLVEIICVRRQRLFELLRLRKVRRSDHETCQRQQTQRAALTTEQSSHLVCCAACRFGQISIQSIHEIVTTNRDGDHVSIAYSLDDGFFIQHCQQPTRRCSSHRQIRQLGLVLCRQ